MKAITIIGPSLEEARDQIFQANSELLEFRLDLFDFEDFSSLMINNKKIQLTNLTPYTTSQLPYYISLLKSAPNILNIPIEMPKKDFELLQKHKKKIKFLISIHDYQGSQDLLSLIDQIERIEGEYKKIAIKINTYRDLLALLKAKKRSPHLILLGLGELGKITRILDSPIQYYALSDAHKADPTQLLYSQSNLKKTYALLGTNLTTSVSDDYHNDIFAKKGIDAFYLKYSIQPDELDLFFKYLPPNLYGLSVTMPYKQKVLAYCDLLSPSAKRVEAVNTIKIQKKLTGLNTDILGAKEVLKSYGLKNPKVAILGAGGAARAIGSLFPNKDVIYFNRGMKKREWIEKHFQSPTFGLDQIYHQKKVDLLINTIPNPPFFPGHLLKKKSIVLDIIHRNQNNHFVKKAEKMVRTISGWEFFELQAKYQHQVWFL